MRVFPRRLKTVLVGDVSFAGLTADATPDLPQRGVEWAPIGSAAALTSLTSGQRPEDVRH